MSLYSLEVSSVNLPLPASIKNNNKYVLLHSFVRLHCDMSALSVSQSLFNEIFDMFNIFAMNGSYTVTHETRQNHSALGSREQSDS